jgi:excinuclease ABC subunit C
LLVEEARDFLSGKSRAVRDRLAHDMGEAAEALEFERAARLRDRIAALSAIQGQQGINPRNTEEADVFAITDQAGQFAIEVFFFRTFQNWGNRAYFPRIDRTDPDPTILAAFIGQFYDDRTIPKLILVSCEPDDRDLLAEAFTLKSGRRVEIRRPERGEKRALVDEAVTNAREALGRRLAEGSAQTRLLAGVAEAFGLDAPPQRIEIYDNSHIMGTNAVGGMVVAGAEGFQKAQYRKFNIRSADLTPGDDYGMMREVFRRRFGRLVREGGSGETKLRPDLVLIDGGGGQLGAALEILTELGVDDIPVIGVAKGPDRDAGLERFFVPGQPPFMLEPKSPILYFLQRLRDEAHRYAIGSHRARRAADMRRNPLDEIDGIGPARKRALLHAFGSAAGVARASTDDLEKVEGVSLALAERIFAAFHKER